MGMTDRTGQRYVKKEIRVAESVRLVRSDLTVSMASSKRLSPFLEIPDSGAVCGGRRVRGRMQEG